MSTCARCGHQLGVGRFCTNCGHPIGEPVPESEVLPRLDDAPLPAQAGDERPSWLLPAAGAALALLLVAVLLAWLGLEDDPGSSGGRASDPASSAPGEPGGRARERRPVNVAPTARVEAPAGAQPTMDLDGTLVGYVAAQLVDGMPETCWRVGGDGSGTTITFTLRRPTTLTRVGLVNGYAKRVPDGASLVDWYPLNRRVTSVEWSFDDGSTESQDLREVRRMQSMRVDPVTTRTVRLRILGVTPPGAGALGRDYTAISEVLLTGTRA
jgi:hypothetical protein